MIIIEKVEALSNLKSEQNILSNNERRLQVGDVFNIVGFHEIEIQNHKILFFEIEGDDIEGRPFTGYIPDFILWRSKGNFLETFMKNPATCALVDEIFTKESHAGSRIVGIKLLVCNPK